MRIEIKESVENKYRKKTFLMFIFKIVIKIWVKYIGVERSVEVIDSNLSLKAK